MTIPVYDAERVAELRRLSEAATPGPWTISKDGNIQQTSHFTRDVWLIPRNDADMQLIPAMRNALPHALDLLDTQHAEIAQKDAEIARLRAIENEMKEIEDALATAEVDECDPQTGEAYSLSRQVHNALGALQSLCMAFMGQQDEVARLRDELAAKQTVIVELLKANQACAEDGVTWKEGAG